MWTKRQLVEQAFEEIGLANYVFDLTPEQLQSALRRMDTMISEWETLGIFLGYALPVSPSDSDLDQPSGVPDTALSAIYYNLAVRIAPTIGKVLMRDTKVAAKNAYDGLLKRATQDVPQMQYPGELPLGAGYKTSRTTLSPFFDPPHETLDASGDPLMLE